MRLLIKCIIIFSFLLTWVLGSQFKDHFGLTGQYFKDKNDVWVYTGSLLFSKSFKKRFGVKLYQTLDGLSGASRRLGRSNNGVIDSSRITGVELDGISGATDMEYRGSTKVEAGYSANNKSVNLSYYFSKERDYVSNAPGLRYSMDFNENNTNVSILVNYFQDEFSPLNPFEGLGGKKKIISPSITVTQILTSLSLFSSGLNFGSASGYLGHPYTPTIAQMGEMIQESLPNKKRSLSLYAQYIHGYKLGYELGSVNVLIRQYQDSWKLSATTLDLKLSQNLLENISIRIRTRGYYQSGASFAKEQYSGNELYHSSDIRLHEFKSLLLGFKLGYQTPEKLKSWVLPDKWYINYEFSIRDTKGDLLNNTWNRTYQLYSPGEMYNQHVIRLGFGFDI